MTERDRIQPPPALELKAIAFGDLDGWGDDRHQDAMAAFLRSAWRMANQPYAGPLSAQSGALTKIARLALAAGLTSAADGQLDRAASRRFFETHFRPWRVVPSDDGPFLTGYFEPEVAASRHADDRFRFPLYRRPADLVDVTDANRPEGWPIDNRFAHREGDALLPYHDRAAIDAGALTGQGLEIAWLENPVDAFFIHVQGSARLILPDGDALRVAYAAKAGHPYTSIGKRLIERGVASADTLTLAVLRAWLEANPVEAAALMRENRSYVFFDVQPADALDPTLGAVAAAGVQITPGRSLAIDARFHAYGTPIWIDAELPTGTGGAFEPFRRLMLAQDTGSAILGPARGDIFFGLGATAAALAGRIRHAPSAFVVLLPESDPERS